MYNGNRMARQYVVASLVVASILAAGCLQGPPRTTSVSPLKPSCDLLAETGTPCPEGATPRGRFNATLSDCAPLAVVFILPKGIFNPTYPEGITSAEDTTDWANLNVMQCSQARLGNAVENDFRFAYLSSLIKPPRGSDSNVTYFFVHQFYTTSRSFSGNLSHHFGWAVQEVNSIAIDYIGGAGAGPNAVQIQIPAGPSPDYAVTGSYDVQGYTTGHITHALVFENRTADLHALRLDYDYRATTAGCEVTFGPSSYWASHSNAPAVPSGFVRYTDVTGTIEFQRIG